MSFPGSQATIQRVIINSRTFLQSRKGNKCHTYSILAALATEDLLSQNNENKCKITPLINAGYNLQRKNSHPKSRIKPISLEPCQLLPETQILDAFQGHHLSPVVAVVLEQTCLTSQLQVKIISSASMSKAESTDFSVCGEVVRLLSYIIFWLGKFLGGCHQFLALFVHCAFTYQGLKLVVPSITSKKKNKYKL